MQRRSIIAMAGSAAMVTSLSVLSQTAGRVHRIGFLAARSRSTPENPDVYYDTFVRAMRDLGYVEGKNLMIEWRFADGNYERLPALAAELVAMNPDLIVTHALPPTLALQKATSMVPIVFAAMVDPVGNKVVASLARPGSNITGLSLMGIEIAPKRFEILRALVPGMSRLAFLINPLNPVHTALLGATESAARAIGVTVLSLPAQTPEEIERAFVTIVREKAHGLIVPDDTFFLGQLRQLVGLTLKHRVPTIFVNGEFVEAGGLVCYGASNIDNYHRTAGYVDKILKGAKPADVPVEQATKFDLFVNNKTAKALGLVIPQAVRVFADRVIE